MGVLRGRSPEDGSPIEVSFEHGAIVSVRRTSHAEDAWLSPGLIDLQVNGYGGDDLNGAGLAPETVISLTRKLLQTGVTTFLPTLITAPEMKMTAALRAIALARQRDRLVEQIIPCVHLEGPHISAADGYRGAHPEEHVRPPSLAELDRLQEASGGIVGMITLSPHFPGVNAYIAALWERGVHVALGHTSATPKQIREAVEAGARLSTHLGNGIASLIARHSNGIWTQLAEDRLTATMIADGQHLPADMLKVMVRSKGVDRCILVSDAVALAGMPPGRYSAPIGGEVELSANGRLSLAGTDYLAGAVLPLKDGVSHATRSIGLSLAEALKMATENPGKFAGNRGVLAPGARADLIRFNMDQDGGGMHIQTVLVAGEECVNPRSHEVNL